MPTAWTRSTIVTQYFTLAAAAHVVAVLRFHTCPWTLLLALLHFFLCSPFRQHARDKRRQLQLSTLQRLLSLLLFLFFSFLFHVNDMSAKTTTSPQALKTSAAAEMDAVFSASPILTSCKRSTRATAPLKRAVAAQFFCCYIRFLYAP